MPGALCRSRRLVPPVRPGSRRSRGETANRPRRDGASGVESTSDAQHHPGRRFSLGHSTPPGQDNCVVYPPSDGSWATGVRHSAHYPVAGMLRLSAFTPAGTHGYPYSWEDIPQVGRGEPATELAGTSRFGEGQTLSEAGRARQTAGRPRDVCPESCFGVLWRLGGSIVLVAVAVNDAVADAELLR